MVTLKIPRETQDVVLRTICRDEFQTAGENFVVWDGKDDHNRIVPPEVLRILQRLRRASSRLAWLLTPT